MTGVEQYLSGQAAAGRHDSSGRFGLRADLARRKLAAFQLERPSLYVLRLIAAGVRAGAAAVELRVDARECTVRWEGVELTREELENPFSSELGLGLETACRRARVSLESGGFRAVYTPDSVTLRSAETRATLIRVCYPVLARLARCRPPEEAEVLAACTLAPVPVLLNGRKINQWRPRPEVYGSYWRGGCGPAFAAGRNLECGRHPYPFSLYVALRLGVGATLTVVVDGISYPTDVKVPAAGQAVAWADDLKLDLSRAGVVANDDLLELGETARTEVRRLQNRLVERLSPIDSDERAHLYNHWLNERRQEARLESALQVATFASQTWGDFFSDHLRALRFGLGQYRAAAVVPASAEAAVDRLVLALELGIDPHPLPNRVPWQAWTALALHSLRQGDLHGAVGYRDQLLAGTYPEEPKLELVAITELALGNTERAVLSARRLVELERSATGLTLAALAEAASGRGREARTLASQRLRIAEVFGKDHPERAAGANLKALVDFLLDGWGPDVRGRLEDSLEILERTLGPGHRAVSGVREFLAHERPTELLVDFRGYFQGPPRCTPFLYFMPF